MNDAVYQKDLLRLAAVAHGAGELDAPDAHVVRDNPLCGDRCTLDVRMDAEGRIAELAHDVRACVLVQASASILGEHAAGRTAAEIDALERDVKAMLAEGARPPGAPWEDFSLLAPAAPYRHRHACVLLPLEALREALDEARKAKD